MLNLRSVSLIAGLLVVTQGCEEGMDSRYNRQTIEVARRVMNDSSASIDVGAYIGEILQDLMKIAPRGRTFAFEPQPNFFQQLEEDFPEAEICNCALGDSTGTMSFVLAVQAPARSGFRRREYPVNEDQTRDTIIEVLRMDDAIPADVKIDFIKIDVEGAEFMVMRGGVHTIRRSRPTIVFEFGQGSAEFYGTKPEYVWSFMTDELGMRLWLMQDWLDKKSPLTEAEFMAQYNNRINYMFLAEPAPGK